MYFVPVLSILIGFLSASFVYLWRLSVTVTANVKTFISIGVRFRWTLGIATAIFLAGLAPIEYQNEVMIAMNVAYECGIFHAGSVVNSYLIYPVAWIYEYIAPYWNDTLLLIRDFIATQLNDLFTAFQLAQSPSIRAALSDLYDYYWTAKTRAVVDAETNFLTFPDFTEILKGIVDVILSVVNFIVEALIRIVSLTGISEDIHFCRYQQEISQTCSMMELAIDGITPDCVTNGYDFFRQLFNNINKLMDLITLNQFTSFWTGLGAAEAEVVAAWIKRPIFLIQGLIDGCISTSEADDFLLSWVQDIITASNDIIYYVTGGKIHNFFQWIFEQLFFFIDEIINIIEGLIGCIDDNTPCSGNGFTCTLTILACIRDSPATSNNFGHLAGFLHDALDFLSDLIDDLTDALADAIQFFTIQIANVITFINQQIAAVTAAYQSAIAAVDSALRGLIGGLQTSINVINEGLDRIEDVFNCIAGECSHEIRCINFEVAPPVLDIGPCSEEGCSIGEYFDCMPNCIVNPHGCICESSSGCKKRNQGPYQKRHINSLHEMINDITTERRNLTNDDLTKAWRYVLLDYGITNDTTCGMVLYSKHPSLLNRFNWAEYQLFRGCIGMISEEIRIQQEYEMQQEESMLSKRFRTMVARSVKAMKPVLFNFNLTEILLNKTRLHQDYTSIYNYTESMLRNLWNYLPTTYYFNRIKHLSKNITHIYSKYGFQNAQQLSNALQLGQKQDHLSLREKPTALTLLTRMNTQVDLYSRGESESERAIAAKYEMIQLYNDAVNEILEYQNQSNKFKYHFDAMQIITREESPYHPAIDEVIKMYRNINWERQKRLVMEIYNALEKNHHFEYIPTFQAFHLITQAIQGRVNNSDLTLWFRNQKGYLVREGIVSMERYHSVMIKKNQTVSILWNLLRGNYSARNPPRRLGPFLLGSKHHKLPSALNVTTLISNSYRKRLQNPEMSKPWSSVRTNQASSGIYNFNEYVLDFADWLLGFFIRTGLSIKDFVLDVVDSFASFDYEGFFTDDVAGFFENWVDCNVPANIDGTELYNPFCFPLIAEDMFSWVSLTPNKFWPLQIPWPAELIIKNCTNAFNGNHDPLDFEFSDNCPNNDGQERPLCPTCDYCEIEARQCKDLGFLDWFDSIMFVIGSMPTIIKIAFAGGISIRVALNWALGINLVVNVLITIPTLIIPNPISIIFFVVRMFVSSQIIYLFFWTIHFWWNQISFGTVISIIFIGLVIVQIKSLQGMQAAAQMVKNSPFTYIIVTTYVLVYSVYVFFPFPEANFNPTRDLAYFVELMDSSWLFAFFPSIKFITDKIRRFDYGSEKPSTVDTVCFFWTIGNFAFSYIVLFVTAFGTALAARISFVSFLYVVDLVSLAFESRRALIIARARGVMTEIQAHTESLSRRIHLSTKKSQINSNISQYQQVGHNDEDARESLLSFNGDIQRTNETLQNTYSEHVAETVYNLFYPNTNMRRRVPINEDIVAYNNSQ